MVTVADVHWLGIEFIVYSQLGMLACICNPSALQMEEKEDQTFKVIFGYLFSVKKGWLTRNCLNQSKTKRVPLSVQYIS